MIVMALHSEWRVDPCWVVSLPHHARGEALDKVMGGVHQRSLPPLFGHSVVWPVIWPFCRSVILSFGRSFTLLDTGTLARLEWTVVACLLLFSWQVSQQSAVHSETVKLVHCVHEYGVASREVSRSSAFLSCLSEICSIAKWFLGHVQTVRFLYPATTCTRCYAPWYKSVIQLGVGPYGIHNLGPAALSCVYPIETSTSLYNLY